MNVSGGIRTTPDEEEEEDEEEEDTLGDEKANPVVFFVHLTKGGFPPSVSLSTHTWLPPTER